jgi:adenylosuccinate lyase
LPNDLIDRIAAEPMFGLTREEIETHLDPTAYIGRCPQQVDEFLSQDVKPVLDRYASALTHEDTELTV